MARQEFLEVHGLLGCRFCGCIPTVRVGSRHRVLATAFDWLDDLPVEEQSSVSAEGGRLSDLGLNQGSCTVHHIRVSAES